MRNWDFSINWRRIDLVVLTQKSDVSTGQLLSSWPITFNVTAPFDDFCEHNFVNHLNTYFKLCVRIISMKWMELFMCLKLDACLNARQDEAHNPLNMIFSSHPWSLASENRVIQQFPTPYQSCLCHTNFRLLVLGPRGGWLCSMLEVWTSLSTFCWLCGRICCAQKKIKYV